MSHDVSETDVEPRPIGQGMPHPVRPPSDVGAAAPAGVRVEASEAEARQVAEAARETDWRKPSFAKELFLGRFRLDPDPPAPAPAAEDAGAARSSWPGCASSARRMDGAPDRARGADPRRVRQRAQGARRLGMKIAAGVRRPRPHPGVLQQGARCWSARSTPALGALLSAHQSIGVPQPLKMFGTEEQKDAFLPRCAAQRHHRLPAHRAGRRLRPGPAGHDGTPTDDGDGYVLDGVKLWTTNGVVADLLVVMARVPKSEGTRAASPRSSSRPTAEGVTVENRNAFMGLRGMENGVTRFHQVRVPAANRIGPEGAGLKIALTTLNTGRLSLPAMCAGAGQVVPEDRPRVVGGARAVGQAGRRARGGRRSKISFIAATTFALEAVVDLSSQMADEDRNDIRIEAALAKLYGREMAWLMADELVQIRGGRGFETADSLAARGERAVPAEQMLRDLRINRIFEGSTEIMHLLIAREAVDAHLLGRRRPHRPGRRPADKAKAGAKAGGFYASWLPQAGRRQGQLPDVVRRVRARSPRTCATSSARPASSPGRPSTRCRAGRAGWRPSRASSAGSSTSAPSCSR